jgi:hypothetical protein
MSDRNIIDPSNYSSLNGIFTGSSNINVNNITSNNIQTNSITVPTLNTPTINTTTVNASTVNTSTLTASTSISSPSITTTSKIITPQITLSNGSSPSPTISSDSLVGNQIDFSGNISVGSQIVFNSNVPTSNNSITCPIYKGGVYAFKYLSEQTVPGDLPAYYSITVPFQPFVGFNINNVVVVPSLICFGNFCITSTNVTQGTNGNIIIDISMWNNGASNTSGPIYGVNCLIYYQG